MRSRRNRPKRVPPGPFPRPNMTIRELIGLVLAFAVSNAFLSWINPLASRNGIPSGIWNGLLAVYLGFAFVQAWVRSWIRWVRTGDAEPFGPPRRWTALGVAEATVIGGTMLACAPILFVSMGPGLHAGPDATVPVAIWLLGSAAGLMVWRMWRRGPAESLTGRAAGPTIEGGARTERGETF